MLGAARGRTATGALPPHRGKDVSLSCCPQALPPRRGRDMSSSRCPLLQTWCQSRTAPQGHLHMDVTDHLWKKKKKKKKLKLQLINYKEWCDKTSAVPEVGWGAQALPLPGMGWLAGHRGFSPDPPSLVIAASSTQSREPRTLQPQQVPIPPGHIDGHHPFPMLHLHTQEGFEQLLWRQEPLCFFPQPPKRSPQAADAQG